MKTCNRCKQEKPLHDFHRQSNMPSGRHGMCKKCRSVVRAEQRQLNYEEYLAKQRAYRAANRDKLRELGRKYYRERRKFSPSIRKYTLKSAHGMTVGQYEEMLSKQGGVCAICYSKDTARKDQKHFSVDHCHKTGRIRGLLCNLCNTGLGHFRDSTDILSRAISYLAISREEGKGVQYEGAV